MQRNTGGTVEGIGVDIVCCDRIRRLLMDHGPRFRQRIFTPEEISYCESFADPVERFAGRWAAKEAVAKALGTGFTRGVCWREIEVVSLPSGKPTVILHGGAALLCDSAADDVQVSISHCSGLCIAFAVWCRAGSNSPNDSLASAEGPQRIRYKQ